MRNLVFASVILLVVSTSAATQSARHTFTVDDAATLRSAAAVAVSPDGKSVLYRVRFGGAKGPNNTGVGAASGRISRNCRMTDPL
jgi:hypothetical protein